MNASIILVISLTIAFIPLGLSLTRGRPSLLSPPSIFALGFTASYGLKAWLIAVDPDLYITYPDRFPHDVSSQNIAVVLPWVALLVFYLGYYARFRLPINLFPRLSFSSLGLKITRSLSFLSLLGGLFSILALLYVLKQQVYLFPLSLEAVGYLRNAIILAWKDYPLLFHFPVYAGFSALLAVHANVCLKKNTRVDDRIHVFPIITIVVCTAVLLILGSRMLLLSFFLSLILYRHYFVKSISFFRQLSCLVLIVVLAGYLGIIQRTLTPVGQMTSFTLSRSLSSDGSSSHSAPRVLAFPHNLVYRLSGSYEQYETFVAVMYARPSFEWGRTILEDVFLTYIPRAFWPEKPIDFGYIRAQNAIFFDYWSISRDSSYPIGVLGELYLNFGYVGIPLGMFFLGTLLQWIRKRATEPASLYPVIFCAVIASFLAPHRTFGTVVLTIIVYVLLCMMFFVVSLFKKSANELALRNARAFHNQG